MFTLNEFQTTILGWIVTVGIGAVIISLSILCTYSIYALYKVIKNFGNRY